MTDFDPNKYLTKRVHGGVREIVGEEAEKIRERVRNRMMDNLVEKLRKYAINQHGWIDIDDTCEAAADEIEQLQNELILVKAERDGLASILEDVRADYLRERALVDGLTQAILDHIGASLEYNRD